MPRARKPGGTGSNGLRTDRPSPLPATAGPSKQYGQQAEELRNQRVVPMASGDITPSGGPSTPAPPDTGGGLAPGGLGDLAAPTSRPDEPITAGLPSGPGPGPEALTPPDPRTTGAAVLNALGDTIDPESRQIRDILNASIQNAQRAE